MQALKSSLPLKPKTRSPQQRLQFPHETTPALPIVEAGDLVSLRLEFVLKYETTSPIYWFEVIPITKDETNRFENS